MGSYHESRGGSGGRDNVSGKSNLYTASEMVRAVHPHLSLASDVCASNYPFFG